MTEFQTLIKERRSASNFVEGYEVTQEALMNIFEIVKYGPSALTYNTRTILLYLIRR